EDLRVLQATWDLARSLGTLEIPADNRRLVEETTHPEALAALVERMPDPQRWREHARRIAGGEIAKRGVARLNLVRRDCSFAELQPFPDDRRVATRLGEADRRASFPRPVIGPFGLEVTELVIRHYLVGRGTPDDLAIATD